jgi:ubiquinone/menaquinone biosynthesis C-methylase UbiE
MNQHTLSDAKLSQESVRDIYNSISKVYDLWGAATEGRARKEGLQLANILDGESILDVASGTGLILSEIVRQNPIGFSAGIDISEGMLKKARSKINPTSENVEIKIGSAFDIPYEDNIFDLVLNGYMFDLMPLAEMPRIIAEFRRVLKPDGRAVIINMTIGETPWSQIYEWVYKKSPALMGGCRGVRLTQLLNNNGFTVVTRKYIQQFLFPSEVILAQVK